MRNRVQHYHIDMIAIVLLLGLGKTGKGVENGSGKSVDKTGRLELEYHVPKSQLRKHRVLNIEYCTGIERCIHITEDAAENLQSPQASQTKAGSMYMESLEPPVLVSRDQTWLFLMLFRPNI